MRAIVSFICACSSAAPTPVAITVSATSVSEGTAVKINAETTGVVRWRADQGTFANTQSASTSWTAPGVCTDTEVRLVLTVANGSEQSQQDVVVTVTDTVSGAASDPITVLAGDDVPLAAAVRAPGCPTGNWTQAPAIGTFSSGMWRSGVLGEDTDVTLTLGGMHNVPVHVRVPSFNETAELFDTTYARCYDCHDGAGQGSGGFDLNKLSLSSSATQDDCGSGRLIVPGDPDASIFAKRLKRDGCAPEVGSRMPYDDLGYFDRRPGQLIRIQSWIKAGASFD